MSDESDWESDGDEQQQTQTAPAVAAPAAAAAPSSSNAAASSPSASTSAAPAAPPSMLIALPITLSLKDHPALAAGIPAGATLLYDQTTGAITLLCYDAHKRPMLLEQLDGTKMPKGGAKLPCAFTLGDGDSQGALGSATLVDAQARKWTLTFNSVQDCGRFAAILAVASLIAKANAGVSVPNLFLRSDLAKGSGKSVKPKLFVQAALRGWIVMLSTDSNLRGLPALTRVTGSTTIPAFNPQLTAAETPAGAMPPISPPLFATTVTDVEIPEDDAASVAAPTSLGEALAGGKLKTEGGERLLVLPCATPLARELLAAHAPPTFAPEASFLLVHVSPLSVSKKRSEKKSKTKSEKGASAAVDDGATPLPSESPAASPLSAPSVASPSAAVSPAAASPAASRFPAWSTDVSSAVSASLAALQVVNEQMSSVPGVQQKLVKAIVSELYEGLVDDLGLRATAEAQQADDAPEGSIDPEKAAQLLAVQTRIRGLVDTFVQRNSDAERRGTLAALVGAWKGSLLPAVQPLISAGDDGLLSPAVLSALAAESSAARAGVASSSEVAALKAQLAKAQSAAKKAEEQARAAQEALEKQRKSQEQLQQKHNSLVMSHVELEESIPTLRAEAVELSKRAQMSDVFQQGLTEMRAMLEKEIEAKDAAIAAWQDLSHLQKNFKLTWLPDKAVDRCMSCSNKFSMFGSGSKGHCRYCGRLFCKACCGEAPLPELGFPKAVKVCRPCLGFRAKVLGDAAAEAAQNRKADADDDDDEEEDDKPKGYHAATSSKPSDMKGPGPSVLSYDSDELE